MDYRCPSRIQVRLTDDHLLEAKCNSSHCGAGRGTVVFHYFKMDTGELVRTRKFKSPEPAEATMGRIDRTIAAD